jgi:hypothetical protein
VVVLKVGVNIARICIRTEFSKGGGVCKKRTVCFVLLVVKINITLPYRRRFRMEAVCYPTRKRNAPKSRRDTSGGGPDNHVNFMISCEKGRVGL